MYARLTLDFKHATYQQSDAFEEETCSSGADPLPAPAGQNAGRS